MKSWRPVAAVFLFVACSGGGGAGGDLPCTPSGSTVQLTASNLAFDKNCMAVPAGEASTIEFDNQDSVPHDVAIYEDDSAAVSLFEGEEMTGPGTITYELKPFEAGQYYFQCNVHPTMNGTFVSAAG